MCSPVGEVGRISALQPLMLLRAKGLISSDARPPSEVLTALLGLPNVSHKTREVLSADGVKLATVQRKGKRSFEVQMVGMPLSDAVLDKVAALLEKSLRT